MLEGLFVAALGLSQLATALPTTLELDYGTFKGSEGALTGTTNFLGMPFAKAGRLENPRLIGPEDKLEGVQDATKYGLACPQQELTSSPLYAENQVIGKTIGFLQSFIQPVLNQGEDCLSINVQVPEGVNDTAGLPVLMWIHGGGFELGSSGSLGSEATALQGVIYQGANLVKRSVEMDQPVVFVSANYRLNFFGTLSSKEITEAGVANLFLKDQDVAFEWVQKYISSFGGDPSKVTVFGESAGAMSISSHMVLNNGDVSKKFRSAWIFSGPVPKVLDYTKRGQQFFDRLMTSIGCGDASSKLQCAKDAAYSTIYAAIQGETNFLSYTATLVPWYPRPDGHYLIDDPAKLVADGKVANIPYVIGNMVDEGTLFSLITQLNVTSNEDIVDFFDDVYFTETPRELIEEMVSLYSDSQADGSPYDTGFLNVIGPKYKKIASMIGDYTFTSGRRTLLNVTSARQPTWSYQIKQTLPLLGQLDILNPLRLNDIPILGSFHISDVVLNAFGTVPAAISKNTLNIMSSLIQFANTQDPNVPGSGNPEWPNYDPQDPKQFQFREDGPEIIGDGYRKEQMDFLERNAAMLRA